MKLTQAIRKNLINIPGWRTRRKIVVIESDDWGSIRMPSREIYELFLSKGIPVDKNYFSKYDCLESEDDLNALFDVLTKFRDKNGNHPVITANAVVANPDFDKIKASGLKEYHYELITETYKRYPNHTSVMQLWQERGIGNKLLWPQFHGREHLNIAKWMNAINSEKLQEKLAFENNVILGIGDIGDVPSKQYFNKSDYMAAFEYNNANEMHEIESVTVSGLNHFKEIFKMSSVSFIASCAIRGNHLDKVLVENGVTYHQGGQQFIPMGDGKLKVVDRFMGEKNKLGQLYWRRNTTFEPSKNPNFDSINSCLSEIEIAFRWHKPAVINSHRVNFIGSIFEKNREINLMKFEHLLEKILEKWPDVEFCSSEELGAIMSASKNSIK